MYMGSQTLKTNKNYALGDILDNFAEEFSISIRMLIYFWIQMIWWYTRVAGPFMTCSISRYVWAHNNMPWKPIEFMLEVTYLTALPREFLYQFEFLNFVWIQMMIWWYTWVAGPFMTFSISSYIWAHKPWKPKEFMLEVTYLTALPRDF